MQVFDFPTLYRPTSIDQTKIFEHLVAIFKLVFNNSRRKYLCIRYNKAFLREKRTPLIRALTWIFLSKLSVLFIKKFMPLLVVLFLTN